MKENKNTKILVIEDDTFLLDAYKVKLQQEKYDILSAKDGEEGLELAKKEKPDLIILDLILPKVSGIDVLKKIRQDAKVKDIPVIIASNLDQKEQIEQAKEIGAIDYFIKSNIAINDLINQIDTYLSKP